MNNYSKEYTIYTPRIHNEQIKKLKINSLLGDITYSFDENCLKSQGLYGVTFNFFITWNTDFKTGDMNRNIWIKKEVDVNGNGFESINEKTFIDSLLTNEPQLLKKKAFFDRYELDLSHMVIKKLPLVQPDPDSKVAVKVTYDGSYHTETISYDDIKKAILEYTGSPISMGKPLNYYETELEKILSQDRNNNQEGKANPAPFPGDCDLLLYDDNYTCKAIIEFKKRTNKGSNIPIADQTISNFLKQDRIKYQRLNLLRMYFEKKGNTSIPLLNVFYSVADDEDKNKIKIEEIAPNLTNGKSNIFTLEDKDISSNHAHILQEIIKYM